MQTCCNINSTFIIWRLTFFSISISIRATVIANASYTDFTCWNQPGYDLKARSYKGYFVEALAALLQYDAGHSNQHEISQLYHAQEGCIWFTVTRPRAQSALGRMTVNQIHPSWAWYNYNINYTMLIGSLTCSDIGKRCNLFPRNFLVLL